MDQLRLCMNVLRVLVRQPADVNCQLSVERQINGYLRREGATKASLERLGYAIDEEAKKGGDWMMMEKYVQSCLRSLPGAP
jgi:hypothetical protein